MVLRGATAEVNHFGSRNSKTLNPRPKFNLRVRSNLRCSRKFFRSIPLRYGIYKHLPIMEDTRIPLKWRSGWYARTPKTGRRYNLLNSKKPETNDSVELLAFTCSNCSCVFALCTVPGNSLHSRKTHWVHGFGVVYRVPGGCKPDLMEAVMVL